MNFFELTPENLELHNDFEQLYRQEGITRYKHLKDKKEQEILKEKDILETYHTTLTFCTCEDFQKRQLPCIHIYRLANIMGLFKSPNLKRTDKLIADFSKGYADNWKFIVRPCNYSALDIKMMPRTKNGKTINVLTQGIYYEFKSGSIFYDNLAAYEENWGEASEKIRYSIQINESVPNILDYEVVADKIVGFYEDKEDDENYAFDSDFGIFKRNPIIIYGKIDFALYGFKDKKIGEFTCKQNEFVELLWKGKFKDIDGQYIDLSKMEN